MQQQAGEGAENNNSNNNNNNNNNTGPDFYCEVTTTFSSDSNSATIKNLYPLPAADCNANYLLDWNSIKSRLIARIDSEFGGISGSCKNTRNFIENYDPSSSGSGSGSITISTQHKTGQSIAQYLANAYNLNANDLEVISPAKYKSFVEYNFIKYTAQNLQNPETNCVTAVDNKINDEHPNQANYCDLSGSDDTLLLTLLPGLGISLCNPPKNIVLDGVCKVDDPSSLYNRYPDCPSN